MNTLLILDSDAPRYVEALKERNFADLVIHSANDPVAAREHIEQADIILARPAYAAPLLERAKNLRWLQSTFAGIDPLCSKELRTDSILTGVKDVFGRLMREYVFAYIPAQITSLFCENYRRFLSASKLKYIVEFANGY